MANRVGQQLGHYRLIRLLGQGGFAEVYLGEHIYLNTQAAVKVLGTQLTKDEKDHFRGEAQMLAHLKHPHIVGVLDFGFDGETPFLIMDCAPNGPLRQRHPRGAILSSTTLISYVRQVAQALQYAHGQKVIHRDIKPENLLLGEHLEVLLSDFGIATVASNSQNSSVRDSVGTAVYMSPEQIQGKPQYASDQYSLAIIVYEWLTGDRPFNGSLIEITTQHIHTPPPPLRQKISTISPAVEQVVLKALAKDPHQRFPTVEAFAQALEQAFSNPLVLHPTPIPTPASTPAPTPAQKQSAPRVANAAYVGPISSVPVLPSPTNSNVLWPTFSLSLTERQTISSGKLSQVTLASTGQVLSGPSAPLPQSTTNTPSTMTSPPTSSLIITPQQRLTPSNSVSPVTSGGNLKLVRSSPGGQSSSGGQMQLHSPNTGTFTSAGPGGIVRSSGGSSPSSVPSSSTPPPKTPIRVSPGQTSSDRSGASSFVAACISVIALGVVWIVPMWFVLSISWVPFVVFIAALVAFANGVAAVQKGSAITSTMRKLAGFGVTLAVLATLVEIVLLVLHGNRIL